MEAQAEETEQPNRHTKEDAEAQQQTPSESPSSRVLRAGGFLSRRKNVPRLVTSGGWDFGDGQANPRCVETAVASVHQESLASV